MPRPMICSRPQTSDLPQTPKHGGLILEIRVVLRGSSNGVYKGSYNKGLIWGGGGIGFWGTIYEEVESSVDFFRGS